mgnify:CR=1 FL=1
MEPNKFLDINNDAGDAAPLGDESRRDYDDENENRGDYDDQNRG